MGGGGERERRARGERRERERERGGREREGEREREREIPAVGAYCPKVRSVQDYLKKIGISLYLEAPKSDLEEKLYLPSTTIVPKLNISNETAVATFSLTTFRYFDASLISWQRQEKPRR